MSGALFTAHLLLNLGLQQPQDPLAEVIALYEKREFEGALRKVEEFLKKQPDHPQALAYHGAILTDLGRYALAESSIRRAMMLNGNLPLVHEALGVWHLRQGKFAEAEAALTQAIALAPANRAKLLVDRGLARLGQGKEKEAMEDYSAAEAADPNAEYLTRQHRAAHYAERGEWARVLDELKPFRSISHDSELVEELLRAGLASTPGLDLTLGVNAGYDSNPVLVPDEATPQVFEEEDSYVTGFAELKYAPLRNDRDEFFFGSRAEATRYAKNDEINQMRTLPFARFSHRLFPGSLVSVTASFQGSWEHIWLDEKPFLSLATLGTSLTLHAGNWGNTTAHFSKTWRNVFFEIPVPTQDRDGNIINVGLNQTVRIPFLAGTKLSFGWFHLIERSQGIEFDSLTDHFFGRLTPPRFFGFELALGIRAGQTIFDDPSSFEPAEGDRHDNVVIYSATLSRNLSTWVTFTIGASLTKNFSNVEVYEYDRGTIYLKIEIMPYVRELF